MNLCEDRLMQKNQLNNKSIEFNRFKVTEAISLFFVAILQLSSLQVYANEILTPISEDDYIGDVPMVLSASRLVQPLADAPLPSLSSHAR